MKKCFGLLMCLAVMSIFCVQPADASTRAGEVVILELNPEKGTYRFGILFNEYFSGPREFFPGLEYRNDRGGKSAQSLSVNPNKALLLIDGVAVNKQTFFKAMMPGRRLYGYWKGDTEFMTMSTVRLPSQGHVLELNGKTIILRRFITRRYDTGTAVYRDFKHEIDNNAAFYIDGKKVDATSFFSAKKGNSVVRIWPARKQTFSAFQQSSRVDISQLVGGKRSRERGKPREGLLLSTKPPKDKQPISFMGANGEEAKVIFERKGYMIVDGRYVPSSWTFPYNHGPSSFVGYVKGGKQFKYIIIRTAGAGAYDGQINAYANGTLSLKPFISTLKPLDVKVDKEALFMLDGLKVDANQALKSGQRVIYFKARPQRIELWTKHHQPHYKALKSRDAQGGDSKGDRQCLVIRYDTEGRRTVLIDGFSPWFDSKRSVFNNGDPEDLKAAVGSRVPKSVHEAGPKAARQVTGPDGPFLYQLKAFPTIPYHDKHPVE